MRYEYVGVYLLEDESTHVKELDEWGEQGWQLVQIRETKDGQLRAWMMRPIPLGAS